MAPTLEARIKRLVKERLHDQAMHKASALKRHHSRKSSKHHSRKASALMRHRSRKSSKHHSRKASALMRRHSRHHSMRHLSASALVAEGRRRHSRKMSMKGGIKNAYHLARESSKGAVKRYVVKKPRGKPRGNNNALNEINKIVRDLKDEPKYEGYKHTELVSIASKMYRGEAPKRATKRTRKPSRKVIENASGLVRHHRHHSRAY